MARIHLTADTDFYVHPAGDDSPACPGSDAEPWKTWQASWDRLQRDFDLGGRKVTLHAISPTSDSLAASGPLVGAGRLFLSGPEWAGARVEARDGARLVLRNFTFLDTPVVAETGGLIDYGHVVFGACPGDAHVSAHNGGHVRCFGSPVTITGGAVSHLHAFGGGSIILDGNKTPDGEGGWLYDAGGWLEDTPHFKAYFAGVAWGVITCGPGWLWHGLATGQRALIHKGGLIDTLRQGLPGHDTYLPGDGPAVTTFGLSNGWYT